MSHRTDEERARAHAIGQRIAQARHEAGIASQQELADLLGLSLRSVQAYEAGEVTPYRYMKQLESILRRPVAWILHGDEGLVAPDEPLEAVARELRALKSAVEKLAEEVRGLR